MGDFETVEPRLRLSSDASGGAAPTVVAEIEAEVGAESESETLTGLVEAVPDRCAICNVNPRKNCNWRPPMGEHRCTRCGRY